MNYAGLLVQLAPETVLVVAALGVLVCDLAVLRGRPVRERMTWAAWLAALGCVAAMGATVFASHVSSAGLEPNANGMLVLNSLSQLVKLVLLALTLATGFLSRESDFTEHVGEYFLLLLLATAGMLLLVSTENLLLIFVALELLSLCLYVLTAFNKRNPRSAEAALKYFLFGGMAAAFLLFGLSLVYGLSGEINLPQIAARLGGAKLDPLLALALLMIVVGLGFKVAAAPFHLWAPDAYEGAPLPSAALIASGSKVASFFILAKFMMIGFAGAAGSGAWRGFAQGWAPVLAVVAALSVVLGNLAAIAQSSVRRLLAYSAIAHAGYVLIGLLAQQRADGMASVLYYVTTYAATTVGAFAIVGLVEERAGDDRLASFAGLSRRAPVLAVCLLIFLLSLAGIPPLAGFFGKFFLFKAALFAPGATPALGLLWLVALALAMSAVSLYYYLQVLKQVFVRASPDGDEVWAVSRTTRVLIVALAIVVVALGVAPDLWLAHLRPAIQAAGF